MRKILLFLFLPTLIFASMELECKVFNGAWVAIANGKSPTPDECYAEKASMAGFTKTLDQAWVLDSDKYYHCVFRTPQKDYRCAVNGKDTVSITAGQIVNTYVTIKKFLH